jgi:hypothetical protein
MKEDEKRATKNIALHAKAVEEAPITTSLTEQNQIDGIKSGEYKPNIFYQSNLTTHLRHL